MKEKIKKRMNIRNIIEDIIRLLIFVGVIGGLIYGLIKENEVVTFLLAVLGLLSIGKIIWGVMEKDKRDKLATEEIKKTTEKYFGKDND